MLLIGHNMYVINEIKRSLSAEFEMKDLGHDKKILGMEISRKMHDRILILKQTAYIDKLVIRFAMHN